MIDFVEKLGSELPQLSKAFVTVVNKSVHSIY